MIKIITLNDSNIWDEIVKSFPNYDVYYLSGYVKSFQMLGDGQPILLSYENNGLRGIVALMRRNIPHTDYYDTVTPYGYGGWIFSGDTSPKNLEEFKKEYFDFARQNKIVDNFTRYHSVLANALPLKDILNVIEVGHTIAIDLSSQEVILNNMTPQCRNKIRKAEKNDVAIHHGKDTSLISDFMKIYNETMERDNANPYYFFPREFYDIMWEDLKDNMEVFYATFQDKIIAISIMLYANSQMHYHLSGSLTEYRNLAAVNLLLYKAALWGNEKGFNTLHLGGGVGGKETDLYKFKASFNKHSDYMFYIGKDIFIPEEYNRLVEKCIKEDPTFDSSSSFFPLYRSHVS